MADRDCMKRPHVRPLEDSVSNRIERLLANADGLMTGKQYHVLFDARGEKQAQAIARRDAAANAVGDDKAMPNGQPNTRHVHQN